MSTNSKYTVHKIIVYTTHLYFVYLKKLFLNKIYSFFNQSEEPKNFVHFMDLSGVYALKN